MIISPQTGYRRSLQLEDIPLLNSSRSVQKHIAAFDTHFAAALTSGTKDPLFTALHKTFLREFWIGGVYRLLADLFTTASPYTLRYLIQFVQDSYYAHIPESGQGSIPPLARGIGLLVGIIAMQSLLSLCQNHFLYSGQMVGGQVRAILTAKILDKSLRISESAKAGGPSVPSFAEAVEATQSTIEVSTGSAADQRQSDSGNQRVSSSPSSSPASGSRTTIDETEQGWSNGRVINLMSMDTHRIDQGLAMIHVVWTSPIIILICMALLIVNLGYSALAGLGCLIISMIILVTTVKALFARRQTMNIVTDARVSLTQEVLQAIRLVKYFDWEQSFIQRIVGLRDQETRQLQGYMAILNIVTALGQSLPVLAAMISFVTFAVSSGKELDAAVIFSSVALFSALLIPTAYLPGCLGQASDAWASLNRIQDYLLAQEVQNVEVDRDLKYSVKLENAEFTWERNRLSARATANSAPTTTATAAVKKADPGITHKAASTTISETTLVTESDVMRRESSIAAFKLPDLSLSVARGELLAVIGAIGSGKSSLLAALAGDMRKVCGTMQFSSEKALCPQTAWIQNTTVRENILFGEPYDRQWYDTVVMACQLRRDLEILPQGDATEIGERGTNLSGGQKQRISLARAIYSKADLLLLDDPLSAVDPYVGRAIFEEAILGVLRVRTRILATHQTHVLSRCDRILWLQGGEVKALDTFEALKAQYPEFCELVKETESQQSEEALSSASAPGSTDNSVNKDFVQDATAIRDSVKDDTLPALLMQAEEQAVEGIPLAVYTDYLTSSRTRIPIILALPLLCLAQGGNILCGLWLAWWASDKFDISRNAYIGIYVGITIAQGILLYCFGLSVAIFCTSASNTMLNRATHGVLHAPTRFFDTTPLGRILNRFSKDIHVMDDALPEALRLFLIAATMILSIFGLIVAYFHWFAIAIAPSAAIFVFSAAYYRASARELKRHEAVLRGVVVARFSETLAGVSTIRIYSMQSEFSNSIQLAIDDMNSANFLTCSNQRWLALRLDTIGIMLIITSGVLVIVARFTQSPAISGLVLSYALGALQVLQFVVRQWANVENAMNGTERIHAYLPGNTLPVEGDNGNLPVPVSPSWPEQGAITFSDVHMRYRDGLPEVLKGFTLSINAGEHVAIVGRTGAGKSSLIGALFRMCELSGGCISIDGVDISKISLSDLRSRLSIQPQDSILFRGNVRSNLDPFHERTDEDLELALHRAWLADRVFLDDPVDEEGSNFSHGQRQQLGLARLLVRASNIVVCDEATSSVDLDTDDKIQQTMIKSFEGKTVLTVAHRIRTIIHYDRICVMEQGRIAELGSPRELWELGGIFRGMCETSGISQSDFV